MEAQIKNCQNCKQNFTVEREDFAFYDKMQVPAPTFCPTCRFQRRLMFRNERVLYKRKCESCGKDIISVFSPDKPFTVYCSPCWWSDKWDGTNYGVDYDPKQSFFAQFQELQQRVPQMALLIDHPTLINSDYTNHTGHLKNCYLVFDADFNEDTAYSKTIYEVKDSQDLLVVTHCELCYEDINCVRSFKTFFSEDCQDCSEVYFSKNCHGCSSCFDCINLKNRNYCIFNKEYSKEEYQRKLIELQARMKSREELEKLKQEAYTFWAKFPHKFYHGQKNNNVSGDYIERSKNAHYMYIVEGVEEGKYAQFIKAKPAKDVYDYTEWGNNASQIYECITVGEGSSNMKFTFASWANALNIEYSMFITASSHIFGSIGLKHKKYIILNKEYSPKDYESLRKQITADMNANPYVDVQGRIFTYGEFFPYNLSLFDYNETTAAQYFPIAKDDATKHGFRWHEDDRKNVTPTVRADQLPDNLNDVPDSIVNEIIECVQCKKAFRILPKDLEFLRSLGFPIPHKCPNCRHQERLDRMNPPLLWQRECANCGKQIQTSYAPKRKEVVFCEGCYLKEVA